ncbi:hypothetical protein J1N35_001725 [Gossypium stocksii]|uniref:Uncharacterized protein n=1 Tax=Gossypium stocksii TaxID=47602 RepID=A0A9D3WIA8_9ROSI|nr:hypothetical protein J1N35_001725 [Gossypium stocksii]
MALNLSYRFCGNSIKDANHVFRGCIEVIPIWMRLIKQDRPMEFLSVELQNWIFRKLSDPSYFAKDANIYGNWVVDTLARLAANASKGLHVLSNPPRELRQILEEDVDRAIPRLVPM